MSRFELALFTISAYNVKIQIGIFLITVITMYYVKIRIGIVSDLCLRQDLKRHSFWPF